MLSKDDFLKEEEREKLNKELSKYSVSFAPSDIKYIIVSRNDERPTYKRY